MSRPKNKLDHIQTLRADLKEREALFVDYYLGDCFYNGTRAAEAAGYHGTDNTLSSTAWKLLRKENVKAYMQARLDEVMPANEILHRLARIARTSINDVLMDDANGNNPNIVEFDLSKARTNGAVNMVKKIKSKRSVREVKSEVVDMPADADGSSEILERTILSEEIEFEMYSMHEALRDLGKYHKLFTERMDINADLNLADVQIYIPDNGRGDSHQE